MTNCVRHKKSSDKDQFQLFVLAPAHFHAALLQKSMYSQIDPTVRIYAAEGPGVNTYLNYITGYNNRVSDSTHWEGKVYIGPDYLQKMLQEKQGQNAIVILAGNNRNKIRYIGKSAAAGMNVLADKPLVITPAGFRQLKEAFEIAQGKDILLYDIMTERYAITNILQKMLVHLPDVFGELTAGSLNDPAIIFKSVHHFYKKVSGKPALRPAWYFDTDQQGEGIVDVTTHLIDLVQWECFPDTVFNYEKDVQMLSARRWPTKLTPDQFSKVTGADSFPDFLQKDIRNDHLYVYANGSMHYTLKGIHTKIAVEWRYKAQDDNEDTSYCMIRGTKASLVVRQDKAQDYEPTLYIIPIQENGHWRTALQDGLGKIHQTYPGIGVKAEGKTLRIIIPQKYRTGHEQCFSAVVEKYLQYLTKGKMPEWERSYMLTKYYTTMRALEMADSNPQY